MFFVRCVHNHCVDLRFLHSALILKYCVKFEHSYFKMMDKEKKISKTNEDIDRNSSKIDELTTGISMMSDDIIKPVK